MKRRRLIGAAVVAVLLIAGAAPAVASDGEDPRYSEYFDGRWAPDNRGDFVMLYVTCWASYHSAVQVAGQGSNEAQALAMAEDICTGYGRSLTRPARQESNANVACWFGHNRNDGHHYRTAAACTAAGGSLTRPDPQSHTYIVEVTCWMDHQTEGTVSYTGKTMSAATAAAEQACRDRGGSTTRPADPAAPDPAPTPDPDTPDPDTPDPDPAPTPDPDTPDPDPASTPDPDTPDPDPASTPDPDTPDPDPASTPDPDTPDPDPAPTPDPDTPDPDPAPTPDPDTPDPDPAPTPDPDTPDPDPASTPDPDTPDPDPASTPDPDTPDPDPASTPDPDTPDSDPASTPDPDTPDPI